MAIQDQFFSRLLGLNLFSKKAVLLFLPYKPNHSDRSDRPRKLHGHLGYCSWSHMVSHMVSHSYSPRKLLHIFWLFFEITKFCNRPWSFHGRLSVVSLANIGGISSTRKKVKFKILKLSWLSFGIFKIIPQHTIFCQYCSFSE